MAGEGWEEVAQYIADWLDRVLRPAPCWRPEAMDLGLEGKVAVVTGASKGIGLAITQALADEGAHVVAGARSVDSLEGLDGVTAGRGRPRRARRAGAARRGARWTTTAASTCWSTTSAACGCGMDGFLGTSDEEFEWAMQMNFFTRPARDAGRRSRAMVEQGGGAIVNVASVNAFFQPDAGTIDYGAAKAALLNLSKSLAQEFGPKGIHINCVSPGPVEHRSVARRARRRGDRRGGRRASTPTPPAKQVVAEHRRLRHRALHDARGGRDARRRCSPPTRTANVTGANFVIDGGLIKTL